MKLGRTKAAKEEKPKPTGFTEEQKRGQQALSDKLKTNRWVNENGELN
jgi:hypothetical protein